MDRLQREEVAGIENTIHFMAEKLAAGEAVTDADLAFHAAVAQAAHNEVLANAAQLIRSVMKYWIHLKLAMANVPVKAIESHKLIFAAIRSRDAEAARRLMQDHLRETAVLMTDVVSKRRSRGIHTPK